MASRFRVKRNRNGELVMPATPSGAAVRSAAFISTLLVSTAFTVPAFAQIETVVVTAERKAEDIQTVPIAVSAFGSADLQAHQIKAFKDIQFAVPNVTVKNGNFGGANFQIRAKAGLLSLSRPSPPMTATPS